MGSNYLDRIWEWRSTPLLILVISANSILHFLGKCFRRFSLHVYVDFVDWSCSVIKFCCLKETLLADEDDSFTRANTRDLELYSAFLQVFVRFLKSKFTWNNVTLNVYEYCHFGQIYTLQCLRSVWVDSVKDYIHLFGRLKSLCDQTVLFGRDSSCGRRQFMFSCEHWNLEVYLPTREVYDGPFARLTAILSRKLLQSNIWTVSALSIILQLLSQEKDIFVAVCSYYTGGVGETWRGVADASLTHSGRISWCYKELLR